MLRRFLYILTLLVLLAPLCKVEGVCYPWREWDDYTTYYGPLRPYSVRLGFKGGWAWHWFTSSTRDLHLGGGRLEREAVTCFADQFSVPWTVGGDLGMALTDQFEVFLNAEYNSGNGRTTLGSFRTKRHYSNYEDWALAVGTRYHYAPFVFLGCRMWPFVGCKLGTRNYEAAHFKELTFNGFVLDEKRRIYNRHTVPTLGGQFGFEMELICDFSLVWMVEVIYSGQLRSTYHPDREISEAMEARIFGETGPLISVPLTLGIFYTM